MKKTLLSTFTLAVVSLMLATSPSARGQNAVLAEMYGLGVHAFFACNPIEARKYLSMAIDNGIQDPRAFYFRGIVAYNSGSTYEAEADWQRGAEMEASGRTNAAIGRSLARFQGPGRLKLEGIRRTGAVASTGDRQRPFKNSLRRNRSNRPGHRGRTTGGRDPAGCRDTTGCRNPAANPARCRRSVRR